MKMTKILGQLKIDHFLVKIHQFRTTYLRNIDFLKRYTRFYSKFHYENQNFRKNDVL